MKSKATLGVCMIVKNEVENLKNFLELSKLFDQVVIVDTGSADGTQNYIKQFSNVELHHYKWNNSFKDARNFALSHMTTDTWMWLDADDYFNEDSVEGWRETANSIFENNIDIAHLPYYYFVDEDNEPVIIQYRERILKDPLLWEWKENIHEVCCKKEGESTSITVQGFPVIHKPNRSPLGDSLRNWKILYKNYENGERDPRLLYYLQSESIGRQFHELSIIYGKELLTKDPDSYYKYEGLKRLGEAYSFLGERDDSEAYNKLAEEYLLEAIAFDPTLNEARDALVQHFIRTKNALAALNEAQHMNEAIPHTFASVDACKYGKFKYALMTYIHLNFLDGLASAVETHLKSLDDSNIQELVFTNHRLLSSLLDERNIGIIFSQSKFIRQARWFKQILVDTNIFDSVIVSFDPTAVLLGRHLYFHISDTGDNLYKEDCHPRLKKYLISDTIHSTPIGYEDSFDLPTDALEIEFILEEINNKSAVIYAKNYHDAFTKMKASEAQYAMIILCKKNNNLSDLSGLVKEFIASKEPTLIIDADKNVVGMAGRREVLLQLSYDKDVLIMNADMKIKIFNLMKFNIKGIKGNFKADMRIHLPLSKVAFWANCPYELTGELPYKQGVGASETSLIEAAEEMYREDIEVTVYTNITKERIIQGVKYVPMMKMNGIKQPYDLFISSRNPDLLKTYRVGKKQVLWMHDLPDSYTALTKEHMIDEFWAMSEFHKQVFSDVFPFIPEWKVKVKRNGIRVGRQVSSPRLGRTAFISSLDRGVLNTLEVMDNPKDLWTFYGYGVIASVAGNNFSLFKKATKTKYELRKHGAKIVGGIPLYKMREFLTTCEVLLYPSNGFQETQCVSTLEALNAGCALVITDNGATVETATWGANKGSYGHIYLPGAIKSRYDRKDRSSWQAAYRDACRNKHKRISASPDVDWSNIVKEHWLEEITHTT